MIHLPKFYQIKQRFAGTAVSDVKMETAAAVDYACDFASLPKGAKIAITAGSRGIRNYAAILKGIVDRLQSLGFNPFLFAAMGSHGRGEPAGQHDVLSSLGITEESMGVPVSCSGEVVQIGITEQGLPGLPVYTAKEALEADAVLVVNRVKPHTSFRGDYESGIVKMMSVGMGRANGATMVHSLGAAQIAEAVPSIAKAVLQNVKIIGAIAILENAYDETAEIRGIQTGQIFAVEKELLRRAKAMMPSLPVGEIDLCLVREMGKNYSGTGMDTNIIGRLRIQGVAEPSYPNISYLGVLGLSPESHGNATGIGLADFTTQSAVDAIDREATYLNCLTSGFVTRAAIPMTFPHDRALIEGAFQAMKVTNGENVRLLIMNNTLHIDRLWVSDALYTELTENGMIENKKIETVGGQFELSFSQEGRLVLD